MPGLTSTLLSVIGGRLFIGVSRLLFSILIVRLSGAESFGAYILVITFLFLGEWLVDFGTTDIGVRELAKGKQGDTDTPGGRAGNIVLALMILKVIQVLCAILLVNFAACALGYQDLNDAFLIGSISLFFTGIAVSMRAFLRATMQMGKDVHAEAISLVVNMAALLIVATPDTSVGVLVACHTLSRACYAIFNMYFARKMLVSIKADASVYRYISVIAKSSLPLGLAGVLVVAYDATYPVAISKYLDLEFVAIFSVASRLIFPIVIITQAIANVYFTLLVEAWEKGSQAFAKVQQQFTHMVSVVACGLFTGIYVGADFFVGLFGDEVESSAGVLRALSWALLGRVLTIAMAPPIIISGNQGKTLGLTLITVVLSAILVVGLLPVYGIWGAVFAYIAVECFITGIPTAILSQYWAGYRLNWWRLGSVMALAVMVTQGAKLHPQFGSLTAAIVAGLVFAALLVLTRLVSLTDLHDLNLPRK